MKILASHAIILGCLVSFCACYNLTVKVDPYHKAIYKFVKQVVKDWNQKHENDTSDISIINYENDTLILGAVMKAIPKSNPVMLPKCESLNIDEYLYSRKSSIFIIISRIIGNAQKYLNRILGCTESGFLATTANVIVIPTRKVLHPNDLFHPYAALSTTRVLNFIIPYYKNEKIVGVHIGDILDGSMMTQNYSDDSDVLFSDKLADMKGYTYRAMANNLDIHLIKKDEKVYLPEMQLMGTVAKKQNARLATNLTEVRSTKDIAKEIRQGKIDMILNPGYYSGLLGERDKYSTFNTYDVNGFCILAPISLHPRRLLEYIFQPFVSNVWYLLVLSIIAGALVWQGYRKLWKHHVTHWKYFVTSVILSFFQQSTRIRKSRLMLRIMLQIFIFMMIVLTNVYQGTITSNLMDPHKHKEISNIEELLEQDYQIHSDALFYQIIKRYDVNNDLIKKTRPHRLWLQDSDYVNQFQKLMTANPNNVLIVGCDIIPELLETQIDHRTKGSDVYYEFQHKMLTYYENIILTRRSPFHKRLNEMSLRIHESGIKQHWAMLVEKYRNLLAKDENHESMLKMKELRPIICIYCYGIALACFVFTLELSQSYMRLIYRRFIKKCARRIQKYRNRKVGPRLQRIKKNETTRVEEGMPLHPYLN